MRRITVMGLALVATAAMGGIAASAAQAAPPEYGQCRALTIDTTPKIKHGQFVDPNCQTLYEKNGVVQARGNYEWYPGPPANCVAQKHGEYADSACVEKLGKPHKGSFERQACYPNCAKYTSKSIGLTYWNVSEAAFYTPILVEITCTAGTDKGAITGPKTGTDTFAFTGCEDEIYPNPPKECQGLNPVPKEIETSPLTTELEFGAYPYVGPFTRYSNQYNHIFAVFSCAGVGYFESQGYAQGEVDTLNTMSASIETTIPGAGEAIGPAYGNDGKFYGSLLQYELGRPEFYTWEFLSSVSQATYGAPLEINTKF